MQQTEFTVLLVEDNPPDVEILRFALDKTGIPIRIVVKDDGLKAIDFLENGAASSECGKFPCDLILMDLNIPPMTGFEVLEQIRKAERFRSIPVVMLSGSASLEDVDKCYRLGANSYISKPSQLTEIFDAATHIANYW